DLILPITQHARRQSLVWCPEAELLHAVVLRRDLRRGCERVVGLQVGHWPYRHAHDGERLFERVELREQRGVDALSGLVIGPQIVAKRLDDVVGRHAEVSGPLLDHLQDGVQHAAHGAEGRILALGGAAAAVELAEQLVGAVDEMNDHSPERTRAARSRSSVLSRALRVSAAARSNSARASSKRPSLARKSPRTVGSRW